MTDRELLELAAKAAGLEITWGKCAAHLNDYEYLGVTGPWISNSRWSPLTDDGDALRLSVKLNLDILQDSVSSKDNAVEVQGNFENVEFQPLAWENRAPDPYAATRRAIVRVAAEIGRLTKE